MLEVTGKKLKEEVTGKGWKCGKRAVKHYVLFYPLFKKDLLKNIYSKTFKTNSLLKTAFGYILNIATDYSPLPPAQRISCASPRVAPGSLPTTTWKPRLRANVAERFVFLGGDVAFFFGKKRKAGGAFV